MSNSSSRPNVEDVKEDQAHAQLVAELFAKLYPVLQGYSNSVATDALRAVAGTYNMKVVWGVATQAPLRGARAAVPRGNKTQRPLAKNSSPLVQDLRSKIKVLNKKIAAEAKGLELPSNHALILERNDIFRVLKEAQNKNRLPESETPPAPKEAAAGFAPAASGNA
jgi:hypothetical protein